MLPETLSYPDRFKMARDVGFEVVQAPTEGDEHKAEEITKAADGAGIRIDSVMNMDHWKYPLSSSNPADVEKSLAGMRTSLHNAKLWGAAVLLLVPAERLDVPARYTVLVRDAASSQVVLGEYAFVTSR